MNTTTANTASEKQITFIQSLKTQRDISGIDAQTALEVSRALWNEGAFDKAAASALIDVLKAQPMAGRTSSTEVPEGMHMVDGEVYKVQRAVHGSGHLYAKHLVLTEPDCGGCANGEPCGAGCTWTATFEYAPGAMRLLSESTAMTLDQAREFGALYGTCAVCGRTLTNEESIEAGIGPVCASKF